MGKNYKDILEMQFDLQYHLHMSVTDYNDNDMKDNNWIHSRLCKQKQDENELRKKNQNG